MPIHELRLVLAADEIGRGTGHYLNRSAQFDTNVLGLIRE